MLLFEATELIDDHVISAGVPEPGEFVLLLSASTVRRFHDNRRFEVPWFAAHFNLTDSETQQGRATVIVNPTGLFRVSIFDRAQQPLHGRQLMLYWDQMNIELVTDENGGVLLLDNPTHLRVDAGTARIAIEPL